MKKLKKMVAVLLTVVMAMAMGVTVFADNAKGTLTVNVNQGNTLKGQTIKVYKLFDLTDNGEHYSYTVNRDYANILKNVLGLSQENPTNEEYYQAVQGKKDSIQSFANDFTKKVLETANVTETKSSGKLETEDSTYQFNDLDYGYYLVYQTGTKTIQSSLISVDKPTGVETNLKGEAPSIEKTADKTTVNIGDTVKYTITGTIPDTTGYENYQYIIKDTLSNGLTFNENSVQIAIINGTTTATVPTATFENNTMTLNLSSWVKNSQEDVGKEFTVTYEATVNKDAVVTEKNSATLTYGNDQSSTTTTTPKEVKTPTYPLQIKKVETGHNETMLAGATFRLYTSKDEANADNSTNAIKVTGSDGKYTVAPTGTEEAITDIVSIEKAVSDTGNYNLYLNGLAAGTYYLKETKAPDGYNKISAPIEVTITKSETDDVNEWSLTGDGANNKVLTVENSTGTILPSTGGTGTIIFSIVAGVLILGVAASFIKDRKKEA